MKPGMAKEGDKDDDWQVVDCRSFLVHIMLAGLNDNGWCITAVCAGRMW